MINSQDLFLQILNGGKVSDKLLTSTIPFSEVQWNQKSISPDQIPTLPARDFHSQILSESAGFPKKSKLVLENEEGFRERGRLLHYFANHELLAIETMALTLLRFPQAPLDFKKGVYKTLQDEQRHLGLYLTRMEEYGVKLGDAPLSYYFWNRLRDMQSPLDFVVRMSMTFEQANLDFALEYSDFFAKEIHDPKTAQLLKTVHDDEVQHVSHGLHWFNEWNQEAIQREGAWNAYLHQLPYPLNARRAKGGVFFSEESRRQAGFTKEYIDSIRIAGGSRGRVPDYYLYNPECEIENEFQDLPRVLQDKIEDLAPVILWLAQEDDVVELPNHPPLEFLKQVYHWKGELPEILSESDVKSGKTLRYQALEEIKPWGWGKRAWQRSIQFEKIIRVKHDFNPEQMHSQFYSKSYWKKFLNQRVQGVVIENGEELKNFIFKNSGKYIFKSDHSTSGRGHVVFDSMESVKELLRKKTISGVIEPFYSKVADFSIQYEITHDQKVKKFEPRFFFVDERFQYLGGWLGPIPQQHELYSAWQIIEKNRKVISDVHESILLHLIKEGYVGPVGIDAMVIEQDGSLTVVPVIEVNVRYTMGRIAHAIESALRKKGHSGSAQLKFYSQADLKRANVSSFVELRSQLATGSFVEITPAEIAKSNWAVVTVYD